MNFKIGDLVKIQEAYISLEDNGLIDWIGVVLSYRGECGLGGECEWVVQWAHQPHEAVEYGYYLEVI